MSNVQYVNQVTLDFLANRRGCRTSDPIMTKTSRIDNKFYKRRVYDLTKSLLNNSDIPEFLPAGVSNAFKSYQSMCNMYFKSLDSNDIQQADHSPFPSSHKSATDIALDGDCAATAEIDSFEFDKRLSRTCEISSNNTLDSFVKFESVTKSSESAVIIPSKKKINLKNPKLKTKGIRTDDAVAKKRAPKINTVINPLLPPDSSHNEKKNISL